MRSAASLCAAVGALLLQAPLLHSGPDDEAGRVWFRKGEMLRNAAVASAVRAASSEPRIDVVWYRLELAVTTGPNRVDGCVTMRARSVVDTLQTITLDLSSPLTVDSVLMAGSPVPFSRSTSTLMVSLDRPYARDELSEVTVFYHGLPPTTGFGSFTFSSHGDVPWIWSLSEPYGARDWWPCKDHPLDKADSVDLHITCSTAFSVGSNGRLLGVTDNGNGTRTWHWSERHPIATYLVSVAITNYVAFSNWFRYSPVDSMEVLNFVTPEHLQYGLTNLPRTIDMLAIFSNLFGLYPFIDEKYGHAEFGSGGAMEHQTMTSATYLAFAEYVVAHELAHQWFGDLITCASWPHLWLNEGFATYAEALYFEARYGASSYWSDILPKLSSAKLATGTLVVQDTANIFNLFAHDRVYNKGAAVLHMLRHVLGDTLFFRSLKQYALDPGLRYGTAQTSDFQRICETVATRDLDFFFDAWVYGEGYPQYGYSWVAQPAGGGYDVTITLSQTATGSTPSFFPMPVDLRFTGAGGDTTCVVFHSASGQQFLVHLPFEPTGMDLDPETWILRDAVAVPVTGDPTLYLPDAAELLPNYPNPFNPRTTLEFRLPAGGFVTLTVFDLLGREVAGVVDGWRSAGVHRVTIDASNWESGVYFCRLTAGGTVQTRRLMMLK